MQGQRAQAARLWDVAAKRFFLTGKHDVQRAYLERRVAEIAAHTASAAQSSSQAAKAALEATAASITVADPDLVPLVFVYVPCISAMHTPCVHDPSVCVCTLCMSQIR